MPRRRNPRLRARTTAHRAWLARVLVALSSGGVPVTKREALAQFREHALPAVRAQYEQDGRVDRVARAEAWSNWTDALCKDRQITRYQDSHWTNPF